MAEIKKIIRIYFCCLEVTSKMRGCTSIHTLKL